MRMTWDNPFLGKHAPDDPLAGLWPRFRLQRISRQSIKESQHCCTDSNNMDRLTALEAFVRVAEAQSFSEAARRLRSSKSAVSRHVSALEADLGVRLFQRTTRSLNLTEAGRGYFERATRILADLDEANLAVSQLQAAPRGRLRVSAPMSFGFLHLAPALPDFLALYPEIAVDITMNDRFVDLVDEGFDIALRIGALEDFEPDRPQIGADPPGCVRKSVLFQVAGDSEDARRYQTS